MTSGKKAFFALFIGSVVVLLFVYYSRIQTATLVGSEDLNGGPGVEADSETSSESGGQTSGESHKRQDLETADGVSTGGDSKSDDATEPSPFATVNEAVPEDASSESDVVIETDVFELEDPNQELAAPNDEIIADDENDQGRLSNPIVVPESYPISEAGRYFVPKEDRRPGNLGGPPPLNFPGGPNQDETGGFGDAIPPPELPQ